MGKFALCHDSVLSGLEATNNKNLSETLLSDDFKRALDLLPQLIWLSKDNFGYANKALRSFLKIDCLQILDSDWLKSMHPKDAADFYNIWQNAKNNLKNFETRCRLKNTSGDYIYFLLTAEYTLSHTHGSEWVFSFSNINDTVVKLRETEELLRTHTKMLDMSVDCIKVITPTGYISNMNKSGCVALLGTEHVKKFGMEWLGLLPPEVRDQGLKAIQLAAKGRNARFTGKSVSSGDTMYWDNILTPVLDEKGRTSSILCVSRDVTPQRIAENKLKISNIYDELTGLINRRSFKSKLKQLIGSAQKNNTQLGLLLIDLDHFKSINDTLGHSAGDHLLKVLSKRLSKCLDQESYLSRLGGDEFAIIVKNISSVEQLKQLSNKLLKQNQSPIMYLGKSINAGMSIGGAIYPQDAMGSTDLMKCADTALNDLKGDGVGGLRLYHADMMKFTQQRSQQLETAQFIIRNQLIEAYYQPKVRLDNRNIIGFEALLRWIDAKGQVHYPATIAEAFNNYELATNISSIMHQRIFTDMADWIKQQINIVPVAINASPIEFMRDNYAELMMSQLEKYKIPAELIEIEITEHILSQRNSDFVVRALKKLKNYGLRISLDDFGTGHSSMTHLRDYPVDCLKIDCTFVNRMNEDKSIHSIVEGITKLGPILNLDVIAEGVESKQQLDSLQLIGCEYGQGFLFGAAVSANEVQSILSNSV